MRVEYLLTAIALSLSAAACSGGSNTSPSTTGGSTSTQSQTILSVQRWTGTLNIRSKLAGGGATNQAGMSITEAYEQDTTAQLAVTLTKDPNGLREWRGPATGNVQIRNVNNLTTAPFPVPPRRVWRRRKISSAPRSSPATSGIGGFIASAVRIPYLFDWNLTGTP